MREPQRLELDFELRRVCEPGQADPTGEEELVQVPEPPCDRTHERTRKHEFHASTAAWGTGVDPDLGYGIWHSTSYTKDGSHGRNYGAFNNARVDELLVMNRVDLVTQYDSLWSRLRSILR